ncbi:MAG: hypothetical protein IJ733_09555, partial [Lachnospiraceae bacterium]|nr:hypothetical protein [Lachnospiraceae bacterium]
PNQSFVQYEYYKFSVYGKEYTGGVFYMTDLPGSSAAVLDVTYLPVFPQWNEPSKSTQFREIGIKGVLLNLGVTAGVVCLWVLIARTNEPVKWRSKAHERWEKRQEKKVSSDGKE